MRAESNMPRPPRPGRVQASGSDGSTRLRLLGIGLVILGFVLLISLRGIARYYTDWLWFDSLDLAGVWTRILGAKIALAVIFIGFFFLLLLSNLIIADRLAPPFRPAGPDEEVLARYRDLVGRRSGIVRAVVAGLFALSAGIGASSQWQNWLLYRNRQEFGVLDPQFGIDIGFYVFELPFMTFVVDWLFTAILIAVVVTAGAHYLNGGIRLQAPDTDPRVTPQVKGHLSVLLAALALIKAADYWLARFELTASRNGTVDGATYTDINARLPVFNLLILIALFAVVLFLVNIRLRGWVLPAVAVGLWLIVSTVMQGIYPFAVQRFSVEPSEASREEFAINRNIEATRAAYGLDRVALSTYDYTEELTADDLVANADILNAVPLLDPAIVDGSFRLEQAQLDFYRFPRELDVDRYEIDGVQTPVVLGVRSLNTSGLTSPSWENEHISFTHGYGLAVAPSNTFEDQRPRYVIADTPLANSVADDIDVTEPRVYHGEDMDGYAIVGTSGTEVDFLRDGERVETNYAGLGGVDTGGLLRKSAFALRFGSLDILISNLLTDDSKVLYNRDVELRLREIAPFLTFDSDPYPVVHDGRIKYMVDAYTTTSRYPYSQRADREQLAGLPRSFNYVRNSVKAVVDTYDGTVELYIVDPNDPIAQAWKSAFPELFADAADVPADLGAHFRYPEDLFTVQTNMWGLYRLGNSQQFYEEAGRWSVAQDPGGVTDIAVSQVTSADGFSTQSREERVDPYYTVLRLPEQNEPDFVIVRSFVEASNDDSLKEMTAMMVGVGDWGEADYGTLRQYGMPQGASVKGPALAAAGINSKDDVAAKISLLNVEGTKVEIDDMIIVPIEDSLLYVRPLYVTPTSTNDPALEWVVTAYGDELVMCPTFGDTLVALFGVEVPGTATSSNPQEECLGDITDAVVRTSVGTPLVFAGDSAELLSEVSRLLEDADTARLGGDLGEYQMLVSEALALLESQGEADGGVSDAATTEES